jgi:hypothetical protein
MRGRSKQAAAALKSGLVKGSDAGLLPTSDINPILQQKEFTLFLSKI